MSEIIGLSFGGLSFSTAILMAVCAVSGVLVFLSVKFARKTRTKILFSSISFLVALSVTYVTAFPIYFNESTEKIPFSEKTLEIDIKKSFYPTKSTKLVMKNEKGECISSCILEGDKQSVDYTLGNYNKIRNQNMKSGVRFIIFDWCIVYEDESGELCCVNSEDYNSKSEKDPFFKNIYQMATEKTN